MYVFNRYRQLAAEVDAEIGRLNDQLAKAKAKKRRLIWSSYYHGAYGLLLRKRLRERKKNGNS